MKDKIKTRTVPLQLLKDDAGEFTGDVKAVIATLDVVDHHRDIVLSGAIGKQEVVGFLITTMNLGQTSLAAVIYLLVKVEFMNTVEKLSSRANCLQTWNAQRR